MLQLRPVSELAGPLVTRPEPMPSAAARAAGRAHNSTVKSPAKGAGPVGAVMKPSPPKARAPSLGKGPSEITATAPYAVVGPVPPAVVIENVVPGESRRTANTASPATGGSAGGPVGNGKPATASNRGAPRTTVGAVTVMAAAVPSCWPTVTGMPSVTRGTPANGALARGTPSTNTVTFPVAGSNDTARWVLDPATTLPGGVLTVCVAPSTVV